MANTTREHIIPNAIGGRKTVRNFICRNCNSNSGEKWDSELIKQFQLFCTMLDISRERGKNQPAQVETVSGRKLTWHADGTLIPKNPTIKKRTIDNATHISIHARSIDELRTMLSGVKKTHPELDVEKIVSQANFTKEYLDEPLHSSLIFGGKVAGHSIIKSSLALACEIGLSINDCEHAKEYLQCDGSPCFGYFNVTDPILNRPRNIPLHCVYVNACSSTRLVLAYIEYFGFLKIVACLSSSYSGPTLERCYAVNPITGEELSIEVSLNLAKEDIPAIYNYKKVDYERTKKDLDSTLSVWSEIDRNRALKRAVDDALELTYSHMNLKPEDVIPEDRIPEFTNLVVRELAPCILRLQFGYTLTPIEIQAIKDYLPLE